MKESGEDRACLGFALQNVDDLDHLAVLDAACCPFVGGAGLGDRDSVGHAIIDVVDERVAVEDCQRAFLDSAFRNAIRGVLRVVSGHDGPT